MNNMNFPKRAKTVSMLGFIGCLLILLQIMALWFEASGILPNNKTDKYHNIDIKFGFKGGICFFKGDISCSFSGLYLYFTLQL